MIRHDHHSITPRRLFPGKHCRRAVLYTTTSTNTVSFNLTHYSRAIQWHRPLPATPLLLISTRITPYTLTHIPFLPPFLHFPTVAQLYLPQGTHPTQLLSKLALQPPHRNMIQTNVLQDQATHIIIQSSTKHWAPPLMTRQSSQSF